MEISITGMGDGDEKEVLRASAMFLVYVADGDDKCLVADEGEHDGPII